jgi:hypothetical protein
MALTSKKKTLLISGIAVAAVLLILLIVYLVNKSSIDRWFSTKFMSDEEFSEYVSDNLADTLREGLFAACDFVPDLSEGADFTLEVSAEEALMSRLGISSRVGGIFSGSADYSKGAVNVRLDRTDVRAAGSTELTEIDATVDFPNRRTFVRLPQFDDMTLELTSLYGADLDSALASIAPIVDVERIIDSLSGTFGASSEGKDFFETLHDARKSITLERDETFWGIGVKEGRDCACVEAHYDLAGYDMRVKTFADETARVLGFEVLFNTGKNRLGCLFDFADTQESGSDPKVFESAYEVSLDAIKVLNGTIASEIGEGQSKVSVDAVPGKLIKSFIGGGDITLTAELTAQGGTTQKTVISLMADNACIAAINVDIKATDPLGKKPERLGTGAVTDISELNILDYGDIGEIAEFIVSRIEELDLQPLRDAVDSYIKAYVNPVAGYDLLKEFWSNGMLGTVISVLTGKTTTTIKTPEPEPAPVTEPEPTGQTPEESADDPGQTEQTPDDPGQAGQAPEEEAGSPGQDGQPAETKEPEKPTEPAKLTPEEIEAKKKEFLAKYKYSFPIESDDPKADWGDEVVMDIVPLIMGAPYLGMEYKDAYAYLGEQWYGEGLDEEVIGSKVGDVMDVEATLGDDFGAFSGYKGKFRVTITAIHKYVRPEWTESFVVDRLGYDSLEACEEAILGALD